jgi:hypothetical protein
MNSTALDLRLPGIYFQPEVRASAPPLPPLDVAAFVGFAERGPLHTPVALEDLATYQAIFGGNVALARTHGEQSEYAYLPMAVATFFANGGRRCYVVRVAEYREGIPDSLPATASRLPLPGLVALPENGPGPTLTAIQAASAGSWSSQFGLATRLEATPLPAANFIVSGDRTLAWDTGAAPQAIAPGDLLHLEFDDGRRFYFPVNQLDIVDELTEPDEALPEASQVAPSRNPVLLTANQLWQIGAEFLNLLDSASTADVVFKRLTLDGQETLDLWPVLDLDPKSFGLYATGDLLSSASPVNEPAAALAAGDVLWLQQGDTPGYLCALKSVEKLEVAEAVTSPPQQGLKIITYGFLHLGPGQSLPDPDADTSSPATISRVDRYRFELHLWEGTEKRPTYAPLALNSNHARFWGHRILIESSKLSSPAFEVSQQESEAVADWFRQLQAGQRLSNENGGPVPQTRLQTVALAALLAPLAEIDPELTYLPLGMQSVLTESEIITTPEAMVGRDGLAKFDPAIFIDSDLLPAASGRLNSVRSLLSDGYEKNYVNNQRLNGLHSLLYLPEVALITVPDAIHPAWRIETVADVAAPTISAVLPACAPLNTAARVAVVGSGFTADTKILFGDDGQAGTNLKRLTSQLLLCTAPSGATVASVPVTVITGSGEGRKEAAFAYCDDTFHICLEQLKLTAVLPASGPINTEPNAPFFVAVQGEAFENVLPLQLFFGDEEAFDLEILDDSTLIAAVPASALPHTVTMTVRNQNGDTASLTDAYTYLNMARNKPPQEPVLQPLTEFSATPLLEIQRALINLCQARQDVVGIFTLPAHYEKPDCIAWQEQLRTELGLPRRRQPQFGDNRVLADLSYAAVYHPWLVIALEDVSRRSRSSQAAIWSIPADGVICGLIATRERAQQVWVAPANEPLQGILGLTPTFNESDWADLFELQFNLIRPEPRDFRAMSAHTLSDDRHLLQISVRRLLILLRKMALERGMDFVFENNEPGLWTSARQDLEFMLQDLFRQGAFAGATPRAAFRVITDERVNTRQQVDNGQFVIQLQVAPAQPLEFITVLLTRSSSGALQTREVA